MMQCCTASQIKTQNVAQRPRLMRLRCSELVAVLYYSYVMSNGYKPAPLDLSDVKLTAGQEVLVDKLAENAHNVWAKDRIKQGWTYGIQQVATPSPPAQVSENMRSKVAGSG